MTTDISRRTELFTALTSQYRVERELGSGGMATVYLAHDVKHDRKVALKVLSRSSPPCWGPSGSWPRSGRRRA
jgi:serine/threonine protein kinase